MQTLRAILSGFLFAAAITPVLGQTVSIQSLGIIDLKRAVPVTYTDPKALFSSPVFTEEGIYAVCNSKTLGKDSDGSRAAIVQIDYEG